LTDSPVLFVSHAAIDSELARLLKEIIGRAFNRIDVFVSSDPEDLPVGDPWIEQILGALGRAKLIAVLGTDRALNRKWVWFEAGAGWDRRRQIVTCCVGKTRKGLLPPPFGLHTALNLDEPEGCKVFFDLIGKEFGLAGQLVDLNYFCQNLIRLDVRAEERFAIATQEHSEKAFHDARQRSMHEKIASTDVSSRDLLRFLLINGECNGQNIYAAACFLDTFVGQYLEKAVASGLVSIRIERAGNMEVARWWSVNPEFSSRLKPILFPRPDAEGAPKFRL
jgi:TIR domain-containing protein